MLAIGQQIDFEAMNGHFARPLGREFVDGVGRFEIDFLEVYLHRTAILWDGACFDMSADLNGLSMHRLHKHPQWSSYGDQCCTPESPGFPGGRRDLNVFFARSGWLPG